MRKWSAFRILTLAIIFLLLATALLTLPTLAAEKVRLSPDRGEVGDIIDIVGTGFRVGTEQLYFYFSRQAAAVNNRIDDGVNVYKLVKKTRPDANGEVRTDFEVPALLDEGTVGSFGEPEKVVSGKYYLYAAYGDSDRIESVAEFMVRGITLSPASGKAGNLLTVSGVGFGREVAVTLTFSDSKITAVESDAEGSFTVSFIVPDVKASVYDIEAKDKYGNSAAAKFALESPPVASISLSPAIGHIGMEVAVTGSGFKARYPINITYNNESITTTSAADGAFFATFKIPPIPSGEHTITASDGTNLLTTSFVIELDAPPDPALLLPEDGAEVMTQVYLDWEDVSDESQPVTYSLQISSKENFTTSSVVLEKTELVESKYTLTQEEKLKLAPGSDYYWREKAIDGASNESSWSATRSFRVAEAPELVPPVPPSSPAWLSYLWWGLGAIGIIGLALLSYWLSRRIASLRQNK